MKKTIEVALFWILALTVCAGTIILMVDCEIILSETPLSDGLQICLKHQAVLVVIALVVAILTCMWIALCYLGFAVHPDKPNPEK